MIYTYDHDTVETQNIGGQLFCKEDVGNYKGSAMQTFVNKYGVNRLYNVTSKYTETSESAPVMISCFDNMKARKNMFDNWKKDDSQRKLFIDGRLLAEEYEVYFVTPDKIERYEETLFDDNDIEEAPCSAKQTSHFAASIAADMVKGYTNWISNLAEENARELPFKIKEIGALFYKKIEL